MRYSERVFSIYFSNFSFHLHSHSLDSAYTYLTRLKALDSLQQHRAQILQLTGDYYIASGNIPQAEKAYREALHVIRRHQGEKNEAMANCLLALGRLYLKSHRYHEALDFLHRGIYSLSDAAAAGPSVLVNPPLSSLYSQRNLVEILRGKSEALHTLYTTSGDTEALDASWNTIRLAIRFMEGLRTGYSAESDKSLLIEDSYPVFEHALRLAFHLYETRPNASWIDSAFVLMEESKALNLRDAILHGQARRFAGIPDSLVQLEHTLRLEIAGKERLIREYRASPHYREETEFTYQRDLAEKKEQYRNLIARYEREHPRYYALRHKPIAIDVSAMRAVLAPRQQLLEFFAGDSAVYLLHVDAEDQNFFRIEQDAPLTDLVTQYRKSLFDYVQKKDRDALQLYTRTAHELYQMLFPWVPTPGSQLLVVPDGVLGYLSFSSLLRTVPPDIFDIPNYDFLLWHHDISYAYSASLYLELQQSFAEPSRSDILVCAPVFDNLPGIPALQYSLKEAQSVRKITGGMLLAGDDCTISNFSEILNTRAPGILHLATHGSADDAAGDASFLVFSGDTITNAMLYARDLYNMPLNMDLIFLSACETGSGELRRGEGIISLARAFFYAGARSLVTTLWRTEDARTTTLAGNFYTLLREGNPKDRSLAMAQRMYLRDLSPEEAAYAHPVYWSALIPVGNMQPVAIVGHNVFPWFWIAVAVSALVLLGLILWRMKRQTHFSTFAGR